MTRIDTGCATALFLSLIPLACGSSRDTSTAADVPGNQRDAGTDAASPPSPDAGAPQDAAVTIDGGSAPSPGCSGPSCIPPGRQTGDIDITAAPYGCSTSIDNTSCLNEALAAGNVYIPPGTWNHGGCLQNPGHAMHGAGYEQTVIAATGSTCLSIRLTGPNASVSNMTLETTYDGQRQNDSTQYSAISPQSTNWQVDHVLITGGANVNATTGGNGFTAGIFSFGGSSGKATNNTIQNTLSDCIGFYYGSSNNVADSNYIYNCGDDGISNVAYVGESAVSGNSIQNNVVEGSYWGRNFSDVGGSNITFRNNYAKGNRASNSCLYIGADGSAGTVGSSAVWTNGTLDGTNAADGNCGDPSVSGYRGAFVMYGYGTYTSSATFSNSYVVNADGHPGIAVYDNLETIAYSNCRAPNGVSNASGAQASGGCSASGAGVGGYMPTPVGVNGLVFTPPAP